MHAWRCVFYACSSTNYSRQIIHVIETVPWNTHMLLQGRASSLTSTNKTPWLWVIFHGLTVTFRVQWTHAPDVDPYLITCRCPQRFNEWSWNLELSAVGMQWCMRMACFRSIWVPSDLTGRLKGWARHMTSHSVNSWGGNALEVYTQAPIASLCSTHEQCEHSRLADRCIMRLPESLTSASAPTCS